MELSTVVAKLLNLQAFIEEEAGFPKHLARRVGDLYFQSVNHEFRPPHHVEPVNSLGAPRQIEFGLRPRLLEILRSVRLEAHV